MDYHLQNHATFVGKHISALPTPAAILSKPTIEANIAELLRQIDHAGVGFRPHVKTLKTIEITRLMLSGGRFRGIIASTLPEIEGSLPLVKEGLLDEALYGVPVGPSKLPRLSALRSSIRIILMIDHEQQVDAIEAFQKSNPESQAWPVFIKVDVGSRRAGISPASPRLAALISKAEASSAVEVLGFYAHAGHSYNGRSLTAAEDTLTEEAAGVIDTAKLLPADRPVLVSIGSTPTAHVISALKAHAPANVTIELHAGNYTCNDLQQFGTGLITYRQQSLRLAAEVLSVYPERNEALIDAGAIAISKESSPSQGFGNIVEKPGWFVTRMSQEHGILAYNGVTHESFGDQKPEEQASKAFKVGERVTLFVPHSCITAAAAHVYYVVDEDDVVKETWVPWKGW